MANFARAAGVAGHAGDDLAEAVQHRHGGRGRHSQLPALPHHGYRHLRRFLHIPSAIRRRCSFGERELVLVRAVPELSVLPIFGQEKLNRALPDPRRVATARAVANQTGGSGEGPKARLRVAQNPASRPAAGSPGSGGGRRG
uniref:hypothetical protein n=1 Tax=Saccharothrix mutabilis TaxID=33921 RepID=UPI0031CDE56F